MNSTSDPQTTQVSVMAAADAALVVGVVCRDGDRFIEQTLAAVDALARTRAPDTTTAVLVDSASRDRTGGYMQTFAESRPWVTVYTLSGKVNAAAARNVVLRHARLREIAPAALMLDGDVTVEPAFVSTALKIIGDGEADVVYGQLPEIWYRENGEAYAQRDDRYAVGDQHYEKWFKGVVLLGSSVVESNVEYNERYERLEDIEFSLRVADHHRILAVATPMGTHHTDGYHTRERLGDFVRKQYQRPIGQLFREYWRRPAKLLTIRRSYIGYVVGLLMMMLLLAGVVTFALSGSKILLALAIGIVVYDFSRFFRQERAHEFLPLRVIGGAQILLGLVRPASGAGPYDVSPPM